MNQLGPGIWYTIHRGALLINSDYDLASFKSYLVKVKDILPCETCRGHYQNEFDSRIGRMPSSYSSYKTSLTIFTLTVDMHNSVNSRLGKSQINQVEALAIYDIDKVYISKIKRKKEVDITNSMNLVKRERFDVVEQARFDSDVRYSNLAPRRDIYRENYYDSHSHRNPYNRTNKISKYTNNGSASCGCNAKH